MARIVALTTNDNPYDPIDDFGKWFIFDNVKGYNTCSYLARIARTSDSLTQKENDDAIEEAIDDIIRFDPMNMYKKVSKEASLGEMEEYYQEAVN